MTTIPITDSGFTRSPYGWASEALGGGVDAIRAVNSGSFVDFSFTGTSCSLNISTASFSSGNSLDLYSIIDGTPTTRTVFIGESSIPVATGLPDATHTLKLWLNYATVNDGNLWPGNSSLTITGVVLDNGKTITASADSASATALMLGDSTMMGYTGSSVIGYESFGIRLASNLGIRPGQCGFSAQKWNETVFGGLPGLISAWNLIYTGKSRTFTPSPSFIVNNMGYNGDVVASTVSTWLGDVRAALPSAHIIQVMPFNQNPGSVSANVVQIALGYANYIAANPSEAKMRVINLGAAGQSAIGNATYSSDGIHPNADGCVLLAQMVYDAWNSLNFKQPSQARRSGVMRFV